MRIFATAFVLVCWAAGVSAEAVQKEYTASNGVVVTVFADEFAGRSEYTAPSVDLPQLGGFALVAKVKEPGKPSRTYITGSVGYSGEWRFYNSAIVRGGEAIESKFGRRSVSSCSGSRYGRGCSLTEGFSVYPSEEQLSKYTNNGVFEFQLRSASGEDTMFAIPASYFKAVEEVAGN